MCRKRPFATGGRKRLQARAAVGWPHDLTIRSRKFASSRLSYGRRAAYDHFLATTRLSSTFEEGDDSKAKRVSLQHTDGRVLYRLELDRWSLRFSICEPAV